MKDCLFCNIARKEEKSTIEYEDGNFVAFHDIHPKAPLHLLIVPRKHIASIDHVEPEDTSLMGELILTAQKVARLRNLKGYKLLINVGREGGQIVDHLHLHLMANL
ncbi:MAG: histidine triad nucleotide-binding protein [Candidatus Wildermuthbacteria bacterium]|nr:histidine triad nucleotide-binding protein [Candidatus Wildermuthbacteria bacterium]